MIKIDKNIPLPEHKYPFREMKVGDSFYVKFSDKKKIEGKNARTAFHTYISYYNLSWKIKTKTDPKGMRLWRVK